MLSLERTRYRKKTMMKDYSRMRCWFLFCDIHIQTLACFPTCAFYINECKINWLHISPIWMPENQPFVNSTKQCQKVQKLVHRKYWEIERIWLFYKIFVFAFFLNELFPVLSQFTEILLNFKNILINRSSNSNSF
jgi:hypothetical protein